MCPNGNADLTRSLILKSATEIISTDGLAALTAGRLISEAGISKGGLYHHFKTMTQVENEVLERLVEGLIIRAEAYPKPEFTAGLIEVIEQEVFECFASSDALTRALYAFISDAANKTDVQLLLRKMLDELAIIKFKQLFNIYPCAEKVCLNNAVQIILSTQLGLMTRSFIAGDSTSFKNYWRGCKSLLEQLLVDIEQTALKQNIAETTYTDTSFSQRA